MSHESKKQERPPKATFLFEPGKVEAALIFLKRIRSELSMHRKVHVYPDRFQVFDVNGDSFEIQNVGYLSKEIIPILEAVNTVYKPESIHNPIDLPYKEFATGKRYPWAADRLM